MRIPYLGDEGFAFIARMVQADPVLQCTSARVGDLTPVTSVSVTALLRVLFPQARRDTNARVLRNRNYLATSQ